jgi:hypothetical protein
VRMKKEGKSVVNNAQYAYHLKQNSVI